MFWIQVDKKHNFYPSNERIRLENIGQSMIDYLYRWENEINEIKKYGTNWKYNNCNLINPLFTHLWTIVTTLFASRLFVFLNRDGYDLISLFLSIVRLVYDATIIIIFYHIKKYVIDTHNKYVD